MSKRSPLAILHLPVVAMALILVLARQVGVADRVEESASEVAPAVPGISAVADRDRVG